MRNREWEKNKALQGGLQGLGADHERYLLPQVVGETSGMRGEGTTGHPPSRNFVRPCRAWDSIELSNRGGVLAIP